MKETLKTITKMIEEAAKVAREETSNEPEPEAPVAPKWPMQCTIGPGLEGAFACESKVGYVNGAKGWLVYRGYDIFDLCAYSTYEEVSYLLLHGSLPTTTQLKEYKTKLGEYRLLNKTLRLLMGFPVEDMSAMSALRLGTNMMRQEFTHIDEEGHRPATYDAIGSDEDSIPMETAAKGELHAIYEFKHPRPSNRSINKLDDAIGPEACYHLVSGVSTITAAIARIRDGRMPVEPDPELSHAGNFLYMMTGKKPNPVEERIMDIALILHADHGMNASTFATLVTASTLTDMYFSVGSGIAALSGPLHGGANEEVMKQIEEIGMVKNVKPWTEKQLKKKAKISGFGHRVYKAYDPRARVLGGLAQFLVKGNKAVKPYWSIAQKLEKEVSARLSAEKKIFPNVDFFSGIVYSCMGIAPEMFTPIFAVSRVAGWTARALEYLQHNRIFRPRAMYVGEFHKKYVPENKR